VANSSQDQLEEAVILCGGLGTRLREVASDRPKALVGVSGRPFLEWLLLALVRRARIRRVILATGHLGEMIEQHFGHGAWCGVALKYSREAQPLGTAGALKLAASLSNARHLLVLNGDTFCQFDSGRLVDVHLRNQAAATLWLTRVHNLDRFGSAALDAKGRISGFGEKDAAGARELASAGVYVIQQEVIEKIQSGRATSLERDVFPSLVGQGLYGVQGASAFVDIGTPESLNSANDMLEGQLVGLDCD
jgi:NDP-sugar pyrophosphorylase family protein